MNPKDVTMESVSGALGLRFDARKHSLLLAKRNALNAGAKALEIRANQMMSNDIRLNHYADQSILQNMADELDAEIEKMMGGKQ